MATNQTAAEALDLAVYWARRGIPSGPVDLTFDEERQKIAKRPIPFKGFNDFTTDEAKLKELFNRSYSGVMGVGGRPGAGGLLVVDIDGNDNFATFLENDYPSTYSVSTPGGVHAWYRKLEDVSVGNTHTIPGVDTIRADMGFIMMPGNQTEWGEWISHDDFDTDVVVAPPDLWKRLDFPNAGGVRSGGVTSYGYEQVQAELEKQGRIQDLESLRILVEQHGGHHPYLTPTMIGITRPGKSSGCSASVGGIYPGSVKMFSSSWSPFVEGGRYVSHEGRLVSDNELVLVRTPEATEDDDGTLPVIDWNTVPDTAQDIVEGTVIRQKWTSFVAPAKQGKTLYMMAIAVNCSVGIDPFTGVAIPVCRVLYIDAEMGRADMADRIYELGHEPADLTDFYAVDQVPALDTAEGGERVVRTVEKYGIDIVVIDGLNGALSGDENDNVTIRGLFDHTIKRLKTLNVAILTGDNTGKDLSKGPRGSSVKFDKPDVVYTLKRTDTGLQMSAIVSRSSAFTREETYKIKGLDGTEPITYRKGSVTWPDGTLKAADLFDDLGIPLDWGRRKIRKLLNQQGVGGIRNDAIAPAQRFRKQRIDQANARRLVAVANGEVDE